MKSNPDAGLLAAASDTAFTAIALGQLANAFACRANHAGSAASASAEIPFSGTRSASNS